MSVPAPALPSPGPTKVKPFTESSDLLGDPAALRARGERDGYLFFRDLLDPVAVLDVRRRVLEVVDKHGWLAKDHDLMDGVADVAAFDNEGPEAVAFCGAGVTEAAYGDVQRIREFHELAHAPELLALYRDLLGKPPLPHPRNIARVMIPGKHTHTTPPHQDHIHVQGTPNTWTAWIPLGDCPRELGGLMVLEGSHQDGVLSYHKAAGAGGLEAYLCDLDLVWTEGDFQTGDVLTFLSQTVHRARPNQLQDRVRLSVDYRYQAADDELHEASLRVHCNVLTWEEIYADWPPGGIQWYWRDLELRYSEWDESLRWQKDKIC